jgi:outer membrane protein assembly factor BamB
LRQGPFGLGLRWLGRYSPFQGCAGLAALPQAKIPPAIRKFILATGLAGRWVALFVASGIPTHGSDWPQYRGPNHDGSSPERILKTWPAAGPQLLWKKSLPDGFGSFVVSQGKAYTAVKRRIDGTPMDVFVALDADTGAELWARAVGASAPGGGSGEGDGPRSTPVVDGDFVYVLNSYVSLFCLKASDGSVVWQRDLLQEFGGQSPDFQAGASPLVAGDLVLLTGPAGGTGQKLFGIDKRDGHTVWEGPPAILTHSTPVVTTLLGIRQALFFTGGGVVSVVPESGSELWRYAFTVSIPTAIAPVVAGDIIYHSAAYGTGARAARIAQSGTTFRATELWRKRGELINFWSTPVYYQGHLYGLYGQDYGLSAPLKCVELATGTEKWSQPGFGPGQVLLVDGTILLLTADGKLILAEPNPIMYTELARCQALSGKCWNVPAISQGRIYARSTMEGVCLDVSVPPPAPLRLLPATRGPNGGFQFRLACTDGSILTSERLGRLEIMASPALGVSPTDWTRLSSAVVSADATVEIPPADDTVPHRYWMVREPQ